MLVRDSAGHCRDKADPVGAHEWRRSIRLPQRCVGLTAYAQGRSDRRALAGRQAAVELVDSDLSSDEALAKAVEAVAAHQSIQDAWNVARRWADDAFEVLAPLPEGTVKSALISFADAVVTREA